MPIAATLAESSGGCTGTPEEAMEKPAEAITCWILLDNVSVRSATRAHWDKADLNEYKRLAQLHSRKAQQRLNPKKHWIRIALTNLAFRSG